MRGLTTSTAAATTLAVCSLFTSTMAAETQFVRGRGGGAKITALGDVASANLKGTTSANHKTASKSHKSKKSSSHDLESMYPTASAVPTATAFPTIATLSPTLTLSPSASKSKSKTGKGKGKGSSKGKKCPKSKSTKKGKAGKAGKTGKEASSPPSGKAGKGGSKSSKNEDDLCEEEEEVPSAAPSTVVPTMTSPPVVPIVTAVPSSSSSPTASAAPTSLGFDITMDLDGVPEECRQAFINAADRWEEVIVGDLIDVDTSAFQSDNCPNLPPVVDDVYLCAELAPNDGVGMILGSAGPEFVRQDTAPFTTVIGSMKFDLEDIQLLKDSGTFDSVILHEMGHVLGFGTLWDINGFTNSGTPPCNYISDSKANAEWQALSGCTTAVPVEQGGGQGTQCSHWNDDCFVDELMTGFSSGAMPISRVTIGSLEDMGYEVDYAAADPFTAADLSPSCRCTNLEAGATLKLDDPSLLVANQTTIVQRPAIQGTKQLGNGRRRKLSDAGRTMAFEYGEMLLLERKVKRKNIAQENDSLLYVGDRIVTVLYEEEGELYGVEVRG